MDYWGQGTVLTVSSDYDKEPDIFFLSECNAPEKNTHVNLICLAIGRQPLEITWEGKSENMTERAFPYIEKDGNYIMSLLLSVWDSELHFIHRCTTKNKTKKKTEKNFQLPRRQNSQSTPPLQSNHHSTEVTQVTPTKRDIGGAMAPSNLSVNFLTTSTHPEISSWLMCEVSGFYPQDIHLIWLKVQSEMNPLHFATAYPTLQPGSYTFQTWSVLRIPVALSPSHDTYTCVVEHKASQSKLNASKSLEISGVVNSIPNSCIKDEQSDNNMDLEEENGVWPTLCTFVALFLLTLLYSGFVTFIKVK